MSVLDQKILEFMECDTCRAKPGTPPLCQGCLHNRRVIGAFVEASIRPPKLGRDPAKVWTKTARRAVAILNKPGPSR